MANYCECFDNNSCNFSLNLNILFDISKIDVMNLYFKLSFLKL